ncbi:MAG: hypothetical protein RLZ75_3254 [Pseudomonadota bacterium]
MALIFLSTIVLLIELPETGLRPLMIGYKVFAMPIAALALVVKVFGAIVKQLTLLVEVIALVGWVL